MQSIKEIENQILQLSPDELAAFRAWFEAFDSDNWDREFETDANTGALNAVVKDALDEYGKGKTIEL